MIIGLLIVAVFSLILAYVALYRESRRLSLLLSQKREKENFIQLNAGMKWDEAYNQSLSKDSVKWILAKRIAKQIAKTIEPSLAINKKGYSIWYYNLEIRQKK